MIRLVAIDLDGTLLDSRGTLPAANIAAVAAALGRGLAIVIATGRSYHFAAAVTRQLPASVTLILNNGAAIKRNDGTPIWRQCLPRAVAATVLAETTAWRADAGLVFDRSGPAQVVFEVMDLDHPSRRAYFERHRHVVARVAPLEAALDEDPLALVFNGSTDRMAALDRELDRIAGRVPFARARTAYPARDFVLVDVMAEGTSKGRALAHLARLLGVAAEEVLAIGDNHNDVEMLAWAGRPVVMGNASPELRSRGWPVTGTNDEGGVAQVLDALPGPPAASPLSPSRPHP